MIKNKCSDISQIVPKSCVNNSLMGDLPIRGLWEIQKEAVIGIRFRYADAETWNTEGMDKLFPRWKN